MPKRPRENELDADTETSASKRLDRHQQTRKPNDPKDRRSSFQSYEPIRKRILQFLDTKSLLAMVRVSKEMRSTIYSHEWNINEKLWRFVDDPVEFRSLLGEHNGFISGSFAIQFFERVVWPESDLDLFLEHRSRWDLVFKHLHSQG